MNHLLIVICIPSMILAFIPPQANLIATNLGKSQMQTQLVAADGSFSFNGAAQALQEAFKSLIPQATNRLRNNTTSTAGIVTRCGAKLKNFSRIPGWTTNKPDVGSFAVSMQGVDGDYNHYRSQALKSTPNRALSILTVDVIEALNREGWVVAPGDLGENILVTGMQNIDFAVGRTFQIGSVMVKITEAIPPCQYLCTLTYVGKAKCQSFIRTLLGRRGWYARVVVPGTVATGDPVFLLGA